MDHPTDFLSTIAQHYGPAAPEQAPSSGAAPANFESTVLGDELNKVRRATEGSRNHALNTAAFNLAQIMPVDTWHTELMNAAISIGLGRQEAVSTIKSGIAGAARNPRPAHRMPRNTPERAVEALPTLSMDGAEEQPPPTSWAPRDLAAALNGEQEPGPDHLQRADGAHLFYSGKVNGLIGESESGKTWIALLATAQALTTGRRVLFLDFEDTAVGVINRLQAMGVRDFSGFAYIDPDSQLGPREQTDLQSALDTDPHLIVLDGVNAAMTLLGLDLMSNKDATTFAQILLKPLSRTGAAVVYVDHLPKNTENQSKGGIGAQAKRAMTTGCAIRVDVKAEFGRGKNGILKLSVDKDRPGHVRGIAQGRHIGDVHLTSNLDGTVGAVIEAPANVEAGQWRPTVLMDRITELLTVTGPLTGRNITEQVSGRAEHIREALRLMVQDQILSIEQGRGTALIYSVRPASECVPVRPGTRSLSASPRPDPRRDADAPMTWDQNSDRVRPGDADSDPDPRGDWYR